MQYFEDIAAVIAANVETLKATGALAARPGRALDHAGYPTNLREIVLLTKPNAKLRNVPRHLGGFPVEVREATPAQVLQFSNPTTFSEQALVTLPEAVPTDFPGQIALQTTEPLVAQAKEAELDYLPPPHTSAATYNPMTGKFHITCSVSPDNGWDVLKEFLEDTKASLATAMYDFTSAHVEQTVATSLAGKTFELVLDHPSKNPTADQTDEQTVSMLQKELGSTFTQQWALTPSDPDGGQAIFATSYHIKVGSRDAEDSDNAALWLSSGNWNNSNQPEFDWQNPDQAIAKKSDRDWHVVFHNQQVAQWFKTFIDWDFQVAKKANAAAAGAQALPESLPIEEQGNTPQFQQFVGPIDLEDTMTVTPLLTPDAGVYIDAIKNLIDGAAKTFDMQLQYILNFSNDTQFAALITALVEAQKRNVTIRIILGGFQQEEILELVKEAGLSVDHDQVRIQNNVHNKGMLVDGKLTVISSQNWSSAAVTRNRDAGVIIENAQVNAYYRARFDHDWEHLATAKPRPPRPSTQANGSGDG